VLRVHGGFTAVEKAAGEPMVDADRRVVSFSIFLGLPPAARKQLQVSRSW